MPLSHNPIPASTVQQTPNSRLAVTVAIVPRAREPESGPSSASRNIIDPFNPITGLLDDPASKGPSDTAYIEYCPKALAAVTATTTGSSLALASVGTKAGGACLT